MNDQAFAAAAERLALAKEIKRHEKNARELEAIIRRKKLRLAELEGDQDAARFFRNLLAVAS